MKQHHVIYLRTSTNDQNPENQLEECLRFCNHRGYTIDIERDVYTEHASAWKRGKPRLVYEDIKRGVREGKIASVTVWSLDRWVRDRDTLLEDVSFLSSFGVRLHSVKEPYLESLNVEGPIGRTLREFLVGIIGSLAQMESDRKSDRVKAAFNNRSKDVQWGRPKAMFNQRRAYHLLFLKKMSLRNAAKEIGVSYVTLSRYKKQWQKNPPSFIKDAAVSKGTS